MVVVRVPQTISIGSLSVSADAVESREGCWGWQFLYILVHGSGVDLLCVVHDSLQEVHMNYPPLHCKVQNMRPVLEFINNLWGLGTE